jgi:succinate dehydrogenase/fumarate reductase flavoprotein subunit
VTSAAYSADGRLAVGYTLGLVATKPDSGSGGVGVAPEEVTVLCDGLVLATGGFAASREMLARYRPDVAGLPTTNGPWATGDGVALGGALGARLVQMDQVQVHPTGEGGGGGARGWGCAMQSGPARAPAGALFLNASG